MAAQGDLSGHCDVASDGAAGEERGQGDDHGHAGRGPVLGRGSRRDVDVDVAVRETVRGDAEPVGVGADVAVGRLRRLFHDVAEVARQVDVAASRDGDGLDEENLAAGGRERQSRRRADLVPAAGELLLEAALAGEVLQVGLGDPHRARVAGLDAAQRDLAHDPRDLALELANAGLPGVPLDQAPQRAVLDLDRAGLEPGGSELARDLVAAGDLELLARGVPGQLQHLEPVLKRGRDRGEGVGRRDEEDPREVERHLQVVVREGVVLRRVQDLEERGGRIAAEILADLVDLVEHEHRIAHARLADPAHDPAG